jgi:hypothetical protein
MLITEPPFYHFNQIGVTTMYHVFKVLQFRSKQPYPCTIEFIGDIPLLETTDYIVYGLVDLRDDSVYYVGVTTEFAKRMKAECRVSTVGPNRIEQRKIQIYEANQHTRVKVFETTPIAYLAERWKMKKMEENSKTILNIKRQKFSHVWSV